jgi:hypothetical protein
MDHARYNFQILGFPVWHTDGLWYQRCVRVLSEIIASFGTRCVRVVMLTSQHTSLSRLFFISGLVGNSRARWAETGSSQPKLAQLCSAELST